MGYSKNVALTWVVMIEQDKDCIHMVLDYHGLDHGFLYQETKSEVLSLGSQSLEVHEPTSGVTIT